MPRTVSRRTRPTHPGPERANIPGNVYDKYASRNPIERYLVDRFLTRFGALCEATGARDAFEVGCGEGTLSLELLRRGWDVRGADLEESVVRQANEAAAAAGFGRRFTAIDLYDLTPERGSADLVICCEVLEHVEDPVRALDVLVALARPWLLLSVPREPLWRVLNVARGKYLKRLGNTPGHVQHWTSGAFCRLVSRHAHIVTVSKPLPWTMVLCRTR